MQDGQGEILREGGWDLDNAGHVLIHCTCTTDPKNLDPHQWTVRFSGTWDIARGEFTEKNVSRVAFNGLGG